MYSLLLKTSNNKGKQTFCLVGNLSTYDNINYIYCRDGKFLRGKVSPSLLKFPVIPENNYGDNDEYERINVESDV